MISRSPRSRRPGERRGMSSGTVVFMVTLALIAASCASIRAGHTRATEEMLAAVGFHMRPADTPERLADLQRIPPRKLTAYSQAGNPTYYVYSDPDVCHCLYVGNEPQYQAFQ